MGMKRKQLVIDRLEDIDNHMVALQRSFEVPTMTKDKAVGYIEMIREKMREIQNFVNLEDNAY